MRRGHRRTQSSTLTIQSQIITSPEISQTQHQIFRLLTLSNNKVGEKITHIQNLQSQDIQERQIGTFFKVQDNYSTQAETSSVRFMQDSQKVTNNQIKQQKYFNMFKKKHQFPSNFEVDKKILLPHENNYVVNNPSINFQLPTQVPNKKINFTELRTILNFN